MFSDYELTLRALRNQDRADRRVARIRRAFWTLIVLVAICDLASFYGCDNGPSPVQPPQLQSAYTTPDGPDMEVLGPHGYRATVPDDNGPVVIDHDIAGSDGRRRP